MSSLPGPFIRFQKDQPAIARAYEDLGKAVHAAGPLDEKTRALVKLAVSIGAQREGAVHAHTRKAVAVGAAPDAIRHAAYLALPTIGFPGMMAALSWVNDILDDAEGGAGR